MTETFPTTISGIPCQCHVLFFEPDEGAKLTGHPDTWEPASGGEFDFEILDRKGYRAEWLEAKLSRDDEVRLEREFLALAED